MGHKIDIFSFSILTGAKEGYDILLSNEAGAIVAEGHITPKSDKVDLRPSNETRPLKDVQAAAEASGRTVVDIDTAEDGPIAHYRPFNGFGVKGILDDAGFTWLMSEVCPLYDKPDLQVIDDTIVLEADGLRVGGPATPAAGRSGGAGTPRPRSRKVKIDQIWF